MRFDGLHFPLLAPVERRGFRTRVRAAAGRRSSRSISMWMRCMAAASLLVVAGAGCFEAAAVPGVAPAAGPTTVTDGARGGWVEFYTEHATTLTVALDVYQIAQDGRETRIAQVASWRDRKQGRVEASAGQHVYTIRRGTLVRPVRVLVEPGKVTPVRVFVSSAPSDERVGIGAAEPFEVQVEALPAMAPETLDRPPDDER